MLLLAISFKKQCCDKVLGIVVREFFSLRRKRILKSNRETATHRKTVLVLAMDRSRSNFMSSCYGAYFLQQNV